MQSEIICCQFDNLVINTCLNIIMSFVRSEEERTKLWRRNVDLVIRVTIYQLKQTHCYSKQPLTINLIGQKRVHVAVENYNLPRYKKVAFPVAKYLAARILNRPALCKWGLGFTSSAGNRLHQVLAMCNSTCCVFQSDFNQ